jgi:hypothetical protein
VGITQYGLNAIHKPGYPSGHGIYAGRKEAEKIEVRTSYRPSRITQMSRRISDTLPHQLDARAVLEDPYPEKR